ncbi:RNA 6 protein [Orgyia pseudotsugata cypovirus 5]|uniref:RNA 6 protein n=1 Tax=Orgyia pseudotsugata cypovirus TaxID=31592 RepID=W6EJ04_CPVOP|nr:RNA 6 protein [Orgyia pseudotsugata cypovirus 5]
MNRLIAYATYTESALKNVSTIKRHVMGLLPKDHTRNQTEAEKKQKLEKEILGGTSCLIQLARSKADAFPLLKNPECQPLDMLNNLSIGICHGDIRSEQIEHELSTKGVFNDDLDTLLNLCMIGYGSDKVREVMNEVLLGGENVIVIFENDRRSIMVRGNIGNRFTVLYFDGTTLFEIDADKQVTESLFVGECINGTMREDDGVAYDITQKKIISVHTYDYLLEKVRQWLIVTDNDEVSVSQAGVVLRREKMREITVKQKVYKHRKICEDETGITHGIVKLHKDDAFGDKDLERNMPEFLSLPVDYSDYDVVECGIIDIKDKTLVDHETKSVTYVGVYSLVYKGTSIAKDVILVPVSRNKVSEQGLTKHVYMNGGNGLECIETIGMSNVYINLLQQLTILKPDIGDLVWAMVSETIQKMDDNNVKIIHKNEATFIAHAYKLFGSEPGKMIEVCVDVNSVEFAELCNLMFEMTCYSGLFNGNRFVDEGREHRVANLFRYGISDEIRNNSIPKRMLVGGKSIKISNENKCKLIFKHGHMMRCEDMLILPCGLVTTARNELIHWHECVTHRVRDIRKQNEIL